MKVLMGRCGTLTVAENSCGSSPVGPNWTAVRVNCGTLLCSLREAVLQVAASVYNTEYLSEPVFRGLLPPALSLDR